MQISKKSHYAHIITSYCYTLMLLMMIVTSLPFYLPEQSSPLLILCIKLVPLLLVLPGILSQQLRAHIWLCFIVLFYFTQSVVESFLSQGGSLDLFITALSVIIFCAAMMYVKWERALGKEF